MAQLPVQTPKRSRRHSKFVDANIPITDTLTASIIGFVENLPGESPKELYLKKMFKTKFVSRDTDPSDVRRQRAIEKWLAVEHKNEETNERLFALSEDYNILPRVRWSKFLTYAQGQVTELLGETVPPEVLSGAFSGGASTTRARTSSHPAMKYVGLAEITTAAYKWIESLWDEDPCLWNNYLHLLSVRECRGNIIFTVPKSTTIDRVAAKEPDLNMYLQKGVGNHIRRRLRSVGINLNDQRINRDLARKGSITNDLATLDLSSASDSVSQAIVELLLPPMWYCLLADLRSPETLIGDEWHKNNMFSSMGNGFTFELESLIFWAISKTVRHFAGCRGVISVYGDDIIVESEYAEDLKWVLGVLGFSVNDDKSFCDGPFRESCGGHYHDGYDITPFFLRRPIEKVRDAIVIANQIRRWSQVPVLGILDPTLEPLWFEIKSEIPPEFWGGDNLESDCQLVSDDPPNKRLVALGNEEDNGVGGYLLWLNTCEGAMFAREDPIITSCRTIVSSKYASRRIKAEFRHRPTIFLTEMDNRLSDNP